MALDVTIEVLAPADQRGRFFSFWGRTVDSVDLSKNGAFELIGDLLPVQRAILGLPVFPNVHLIRGTCSSIVHTEVALIKSGVVVFGLTVYADENKTRRTYELCLALTTDPITSPLIGVRCLGHVPLHIDECASRVIATSLPAKELHDRVISQNTPEYSIKKIHIRADIQYYVYVVSSSFAGKFKGYERKNVYAIMAWHLRDRFDTLPVAADEDDEQETGEPSNMEYRKRERIIVNGRKVFAPFGMQWFVPNYKDADLGGIMYLIDQNNRIIIPSAVLQAILDRNEKEGRKNDGITHFFQQQAKLMEDISNLYQLAAAMTSLNADISPAIAHAEEVLEDTASQLQEDKDDN